jgi:hypothetical protein
LQNNRSENEKTTARYFGILLVFANFLLAQQKRDRFNPIIPDFLADPSLVFFNDTFYMYATTDIDQD